MVVGLLKGLLRGLIGGDVAMGDVSGEVRGEVREVARGEAKADRVEYWEEMEGRAVRRLPVMAREPRRLSSPAFIGIVD